MLVHRKIAAMVDAAPDLLDAARKRIDETIASNGGTEGERLWQEILLHPWPATRKRMLDDGDGGRLLRSNTPFAAVIEPFDERERRTLWQQAKAELAAEMAASPYEIQDRQMPIRAFATAGDAAGEHLAAGRSVAIRRNDTPASFLVILHSDGREEVIAASDAIDQARELYETTRETPKPLPENSSS